MLLFLTSHLLLKTALDWSWWGLWFELGIGTQIPSNGVSIQFILSGTLLFYICPSIIKDEEQFTCKKSLSWGTSSNQRYYFGVSWSMLKIDTDFDIGISNYIWEQIDVYSRRHLFRLERNPCQKSGGLLWSSINSSVAHLDSET